MCSVRKRKIDLPHILATRQVMSPEVPVIAILVPLLALQERFDDHAVCYLGRLA